MPSIPTPSKAGIIEGDTGDRHIPSSTRADGSKRKEIKIRPGYKPPEDVEVYKNRTAEGFRTRGNGGIPGAGGLKDEEADTTPASNKNAKRREARRKAAASSAVPTPETEVLAKDNWRQPIDNQGNTGEEAIDPKAEEEKKARNLKKKLKQAKDLKEKKEGGAALLPEQFAKVIKINELIRELDALGFDSEGEPKEKIDVKGEA